MDNFLFLPATDHPHETAVLFNITSIYVNLQTMQFRSDHVCMQHRHCIVALRIVWKESEYILTGKERILRFIDGLTQEADLNSFREGTQVSAFNRIKECSNGCSTKEV